MDDDAVLAAALALLQQGTSEQFWSGASRCSARQRTLLLSLSREKPHAYSMR
jgi:hypothetical protein